MNTAIHVIKAKQSGTLCFNILLALVCGLGIGFFCLVILGVFSFVSVDEVLLNIKSQAVLSSVLISLQTSLAVVLLAVVLGLPIAYLLAMKEFPGKNFLDTLLDLPIVMPPLVSGLAILMLLGPDNPFGRLLNSINLDFIFTRKGIIIAQFFVASPFFIKTVKESMASIPKNLLAAAETLHASKLYIFRHVVVPLCKNGILAGIVMCWARALGEFGATAMVAGCIPGKTETMTLAIYSQSMSGDLNSAVVLALCLTLFSFSALLIMKSFFRSRYEYHS